MVEKTVDSVSVNLREKNLGKGKGISGETRAGVTRGVQYWVLEWFGNQMEGNLREKLKEGLGNGIHGGKF